MSSTRLKYINERIQNELCRQTIHSLTENELMHTYKQTPSVQKKINTLQDILTNHTIENPTQQSIIDDYLIHMIPAGTKGSIKGNLFNQIVKHHILDMKIDNEQYDVCFEKKHSFYNTSEIPDWYILCKKSNKIIIGMNQLDVWNGGAQLNRGMKYLMNNSHNTEKNKLLCVVCNEIELKSTENKVYRMFDEGFTKNTLCYLNRLETIITDYFYMH